jgi:hypothetical protein
VWRAKERNCRAWSSAMAIVRDEGTILSRGQRFVFQKIPRC